MHAIWGWLAVFLIFGIGFVDERRLGKFTVGDPSVGCLVWTRAAMYFCTSALAKVVLGIAKRLNHVPGFCIEGFHWSLSLPFVKSSYQEKGNHWMRYAS